MIFDANPCHATVNTGRRNPFYGTNPHAAKQPDAGIIKYTVVYRSTINCLKLMGLKLTVQRTTKYSTV